MIDEILSLLFPNLCPGCQHPLVSGEEYLCMNCLREIPTLRREGFFNGDLVERLALQFPISRGYSLVHYHRKSLVGNLLKEIKYRGNRDLALHMGRWLGSVLTFEQPPAGIIPIPLHPRRMRARGYNQSQLIALGVSETTGLKVYDNCLLRIKDTISQTRKSRVERLLNADHIFQCSGPVGMEGKTLILLDDVFTTGATLGAAIQPLMEAGIREIIPVTLATGQ